MIIEIAAHKLEHEQMKAKVEDLTQENHECKVILRHYKLL